MGIDGVGDARDPTQGCDQGCLPRESTYKLTAGVSRWPSSKSAVSPSRGGVKGGQPGGAHGQGALSRPASAPRSCPHGTPQCLKAGRSCGHSDPCVCRTGSRLCWTGQVAARAPAPGGCSTHCPAPRPLSSSCFSAPKEGFAIRSGPAPPASPSQEQTCQGEHLLPGAQLPHGGRDACLLGELPGTEGQGCHGASGWWLPSLGRPKHGSHCSLPTDAGRCHSCSRPWAASGACGSVPPSSPSWRCWSCC